MDGFAPPDMPHYKVRRLLPNRYVIDVYWPHGEIEQLVGVFVTRGHAQRWMASIDDNRIKPLQFSVLRR
ncbi:hypothetical protein [Tardiphaga sp.]|uniref:hypothetical protein n=1 Tax=Tardiphaga sp. TaxID=1926292 RepID=UPI0037D9C8B0